MGYLNQVMNGLILPGKRWVIFTRKGVDYICQVDVDFLCTLRYGLSLPGK